MEARLRREHSDSTQNHHPVCGSLLASIMNRPKVTFATEDLRLVTAIVLSTVSAVLLQVVVANRGQFS